MKQSSRVFWLPSSFARQVLVLLTVCLITGCHNRDDGTRIESVQNKAENLERKIEELEGVNASLVSRVEKMSKQVSELTPRLGLADASHEAVSAAQARFKQMLTNREPTEMTIRPSAGVKLQDGPFEIFYQPREAGFLRDESHRTLVTSIKNGSTIFDGNLAAGSGFVLIYLDDAGREKTCLVRVVSSNSAELKLRFYEIPAEDRKQAEAQTGGPAYTYASPMGKTLQNVASLGEVKLKANTPVRIAEERLEGEYQYIWGLIMSAHRLFIRKPGNPQNIVERYAINVGDSIWLPANSSMGLPRTVQLVVSAFSPGPKSEGITLRVYAGNLQN